VIIICSTSKGLRTPFIPIRNLDTYGNVVILRGAEGGVAESIISKITLVFRKRRDDRLRWVRSLEEHFPPPLIRPDGHLLPREKVFLRFLKQWILQLRAGMPFVQNDMLEAMKIDSQVSVLDESFMNRCYFHKQLR
jgi:hypothetical protein